MSGDEVNINKTNNMEEEYYEKISESVEKDIKKINEICSKCHEAVLDNEIYIVSNKELNEMEFFGEKGAKESFNTTLSDFVNNEDYKNLQFELEYTEHRIDEPNGFKVFFSRHKRTDLSRITVDVIENLSQYISKVLYERVDDNNKIFYRGHGNWKYKLTPGIYREDNIEILANESNYIKELISSYPKYFKECKTALDFLSVLQHNGFPTRLLDFSENPLIALYMSCDCNNDCAGDVIRISVPKEYFKYYDSDTVSVLSNIAFAEDDFSIGLDSDNMELFNESISIKKLVHLIRNEKPFFKPEINPQHLFDTILFVKPKQDFERISQQSGLFALFGINGRKKEMPKIEYMNPPCNIKHLIIPKECKKKILDELSAINVNEANVYCDMEHVAKYYIKKSRNNEIENHIKKMEMIKQKKFNEIMDQISLI